MAPTCPGAYGVVKTILAGQAGRGAIPGEISEALNKGIERAVYIAHTAPMRRTMARIEAQALSSRCHRHLGLLAPLVLLFALAWPGGAAHARKAKKDTRVVAVLYFDNNTNDASFDVFQKGFADMLITDLSSVDGIKVVERARLQELIDEIALQETKYFDEKTAIQMGKGLGAEYAITGSITGLKPRLRIDVRMIDIATGEIVVSDKVKGKESEIFDLEQKLVARFVARMDKRFTPSSRPQTRVPDVDTLLDYSKAVDLADKGLYEEASSSMKLVVSAAPTFVLARVKRQQYAKRLAAARSRRNAIKSELSVDLATKVERFLEKHGDIRKLDQETAKTYLAYRSMRGHFIAAALEGTLSKNPSGTRVIPKGMERKARLFMEAYHANWIELLREFERYVAQHTKTYPNGVTYIDTSIRLPKEDERAARDAGFDADMISDPIRARIELGRFLLEGRFRDRAGKYVSMGPPLAEMDRTYKTLGYRHFKDAWAVAHAEADEKPYQLNNAVEALEAHADALFLRGQRDEGIAKLQEILDRYPTYRRYDYYETQIQKHLGMKHDHSLGDIERYYKGLKTCHDMSLRRGLGEMMHRYIKLEGAKGIHRVVAEIEKACTGNDAAKRYWTYLYSHAATRAGRLEDCEIFDHYMKRFLEAGGSKSDAKGYRKNYSKCPAPPKSRR